MPANGPWFLADCRSSKPCEAFGAYPGRPGEASPVESGEEAVKIEDVPVMVDPARDVIVARLDSGRVVEFSFSAPDMSIVSGTGEGSRAGRVK